VGALSAIIWVAARGSKSVKRPDLPHCGYFRNHIRGRESEGGAAYSWRISSGRIRGLAAMTLRLATTSGGQRSGPNGISLLEAQRNFIELGACHAESAVVGSQAEAGRGARTRLAAPIDPAVDDFETGPAGMPDEKKLSQALSKCIRVSLIRSYTF
jgi:hypothetical protein